MNKLLFLLGLLVVSAFANVEDSYNVEDSIDVDLFKLKDLGKAAEKVGKFAFDHRHTIIDLIRNRAAAEEDVELLKLKKIGKALGKVGKFALGHAKTIIGLIGGAEADEDVELLKTKKFPFIHDPVKHEPRKHHPTLIVDNWMNGETGAEEDVELLKLKKIGKALGKVGKFALGHAKTIIGLIGGAEADEDVELLKINWKKIGQTVGKIGKFAGQHANTIIDIIGHRAAAEEDVELFKMKNTEKDLGEVANHKEHHGFMRKDRKPIEHTHHHPHHDQKLRKHTAAAAEEDIELVKLKDIGKALEKAGKFAFQHRNTIGQLIGKHAAAEEDVELLKLKDIGKALSKIGPIIKIGAIIAGGL